MDGRDRERQSVAGPCARSSRSSAAEEIQSDGKEEMSENLLHSGQPLEHPQETGVQFLWGDRLAGVVDVVDDPQDAVPRQCELGRPGPGRDVEDVGGRSADLAEGVDDWLRQVEGLRCAQAAHVGDGVLGLDEVLEAILQLGGSLVSGVPRDPLQTRAGTRTAERAPRC